jgi:hypothetical protein
VLLLLLLEDGRWSNQRNLGNGSQMQIDHPNAVQFEAELRTVSDVIYEIVLLYILQCDKSRVKSAGTHTPHTTINSSLFEVQTNDADADDDNDTTMSVTRTVGTSPIRPPPLP